MAEETHKIRGAHAVKRDWTPLPRYIFRKKNILDAIKKFEHCESFIDIGCGAGDLACSVAELGLKGKGYDFSKEAIEVANGLRDKRGLTAEDVTFVQNQEDIAKISGTFDIVMCTEVLEHIENDQAAFNALVNLTDKYLIVSVPGKSKLFGTSDTMAGHYRRYDRKDVIKLTDHEDLVRVELIGYGWPFTNISRLFLEHGAKNKMKDDQNSKQEDLTKNSGIHIFKIPSFIGKLNLESLLTPFYFISKLFNRTDLAEGYLIILQKNQK